jgi:hypothetical protein
MDAEGTVVLKPLGDVELWFAEPEDCQWRLPLHVEWKQYPQTGAVYGLVIPALCFYAVQLQVVNGMLATHSLDKRTNRWLLPKAVVHSLLQKAPGIHAEFYYLWPGGVHPPIPSPYHAVSLPAQDRPPPRRAEQYKSLAEFISKERGIPGDVTLVVLTALSQLGARWLLEHRQVMDLGFVKLAALPFRINWKEIISFKCRPWKLIRLFNLSARERDKLLRQLGFEAVACSVHNIGLRGGQVRRVDYTIEALPTNVFERTADTVEGERMKAGRTSYVAYYEEAVEIFYSFIVDAIENYVRKVNTSWAAVCQIGKSGVLGFLPVSRWRAKVRGIPLCDLPEHIAPPVGNFSVTAEQEGSCPILIQAQDDEVQKMSALPPPADDMREREEQGDLDESRPGGTDGMPVLDAGESAAPGQPVLPEHSTSGGESSRLDGA